MRDIFSPLLRADQLLIDENDLDFYGRDVSKQFEARPTIVLLPDSIEQICAIVRICADKRIAIVPSGGRTGYSGGATATNGEVILSLTRLNKVLEINPIDQTATVQSGVTTETLRQKAQELGLYYPVDFTSKGSSHIGGNIATNAGGIRVIRYGNTRDWVLGLKVVTAAGELLNLNGSLIKNATGYDLRGLFIGSEGTLGIIVEATMKLCRPPLESRVALCAVKSSAVALQVLAKMRAQLTVNVFEYFERSGLELVVGHTTLKDPFAESHPCYLLIEAETPSGVEEQIFEDALGGLIEDGTLLDVVIASSIKQAQDLAALRERIGEVANTHYVPHKNDISVPIPTIPQFLAELEQLRSQKFPQYRAIIFGHVGDGNLHVNVLKPDNTDQKEFFEACHVIDDAIFAVVQRFAGSISAEHGVGLLKKPYLHYSRAAQEIEFMRGIKKVFDPLGIMNPGKIF